MIAKYIQWNQYSHIQLHIQLHSIFANFKHLYEAYLKK